MQTVTLTDTVYRVDFFRQCILNSLAYWHRQVTPDGASADEDRGNILRAISFGLDLGEIAWPVTLSLIEAYTFQMERQGYWDEWQRIIGRALALATRLQDRASEVRLAILSARLSYRQSRLNEVAKGYRQAVRIARQLGDLFNEARAYTNLGYHFSETGQWYRAEVLCCYALTLFEQIANNHGLAHTHNHLGALYYRLHRWDEAKYHFEQAASIWQASGDEHGLMWAYLNLGALCVDMAQPEPALNYLNQALHQADITEEKIVVGRIYTNMARAYQLAGDLVKAESYNRQAETIFQRNANFGELSRVWNGLGLIYFQQGKWSEATFYLEQSLALWRKLGIKFEEIEVLLDMGECELKRENWPAAQDRLSEIEQLIEQDAKSGQYRHLGLRLAEYRRLLRSAAQ